MYGVYSTFNDYSKVQLDLKPALTIKAQIAMLHYLTKGASLGYGLTYKVNRDSVIAVIPIGYGDGLPRILSSNGSVLIKGQKCPIVGRICMDQMLVDVSEISDISDNDLVTVIGQDGTEEIISTRSKVFQKLNMDLDELPLPELLDLVQKNPGLLRRPIMIDDKRLQVGFNEDEIRRFLPRDVRQLELRQAQLMAGL